MDDLLSKINCLLNEADENVARVVKKKLLTQFHNDIRKDYSEKNVEHKVSELVKYNPEYLSKSKDEGLLAELEIDLDKLKADKLTTKENGSKTSSFWVGNVPYSYSGSSHPVCDASKTPAVAKTMAMLNSDERFGGFNSCLLIHYPDEHSALSLHADDEGEQLDLSHPMAISHIGSSRDLEFYPKKYLKTHRHHKQPPLKTVTKEHGSITIMNPGCQEFLCHRVIKSIGSTGGSWALSFRKVLTESNAADVSSVSTDPEISFNTFSSNSANNSKSTLRICKKPMTLILGTSITKGLDGERMIKGNNVCHNISGSGYKILDLDRELDNFYNDTDSYADCQVKKVIISVGTNDVRHCKGVINHLKTPFYNLIEKVKLYFPGVNIFVQSVLPVRIENQYTVINIRRFNSMLFNTCRSNNCFYIDVFRNFLTPNGHFNEALFVDGCHLKTRSLGILARSFIRVINSPNIFNPLIT